LSQTNKKGAVLLERQLKIYKTERYRI